MSSIENIFLTLSLKNKEEVWKNTISNSLPIKVISFFISLLEKFIVPISKESLTAKVTETLTLASIMLLIFASPFVSTEFNANLVLLAGLCTSLQHFLKPSTISRKTDILLFLVMAFFAINLVAVGFSPYLMASLKGFSKLIVYFLAYMIFMVNLGSVKNIRMVLWAMIISSTIVSAYGCYQFYIKVEPYQGALWDDPNAMNFKTTRVYSFLKNPNLLAGYLIPTISLSTAFYFLNIGWRKLIILGSLAVQLPCLYFTYSRGGWLAAIGMAGVFALGSFFIYYDKITKSKNFKLFFIGAILLAILAFVGLLIKSPATLERFTSIFTSRGHSSNSFRMNVWISCWNMFKDNMLIGIGPGNTTFEKIYPLYMFSGFKALSAYNIFLETMVETGLVGLISFTLMLFTHMFRALWGVIAKTTYNTKMLLLGSLAGIVGLIIQGMADTVWYRPQVHILLWFLMAIISLFSRDSVAYENGSNS
ncbi:MAG: O-antigen ligase family protein [Candidatus Sericytochromatia bacterium]